ncbi:hypothetical protein HAX54_008085 [Datura stramonium]|uniref:Uncharacterized protein n=1 Tax=Datura stramonium TaxID=4076 RepID=A0ABS8WXS6_DATST|nr:hypothetical protein [Datura stramonium]
MVKMRSSPGGLEEAPPVEATLWACGRSRAQTRGDMVVRLLSVLFSRPVEVPAPPTATATATEGHAIGQGEYDSKMLNSTITTFTERVTVGPKTVVYTTSYASSTIGCAPLARPIVEGLPPTSLAVVVLR